MGIATGALKTVRTNVVGAGLRLNSQIDWQYQPDEAMPGKASVNFAANRVPPYVVRPWSLALLSALMSGDVFATLPVIPLLPSV